MNLQKLRKAAGLTQIEVAKSLGITQAAVSTWERLNTPPASGKLAALAQLYHCTIEDLLYYSKREVG